MSKLKYIGLYTAKYILKAIYAPLKLLPTQQKVVFISRQSDYPSIDFKLLHAKFKEEHPDYKVVILTKQINGLVEYATHIFRQIIHIATSKVIVLDSYCIPVSILRHKKSLKIIQMWHSIGSMKKFGYAMIGKEEGSDGHVARIMDMHKNYTHVLIASLNYSNDYLEGFKVEAGEIEEIPLPRVDLLTDKEYAKHKRTQLKKANPKLANKINILYYPTFRKETSDKDMLKVQNLINSIDFNKYNLIYKPHVLSNIEIKDKRVIVADSSDFEIIFAGDCMISDYSSVIYEAGLLGMPVYLYAYDWQEYKHKREFNLNLEKDIPTIFTDDPMNIISAIEKDDFDFEAFDFFIKRNVSVSKKSSCDKILDLMEL